MRHAQILGAAVTVVVILAAARAGLAEGEPSVPVARRGSILSMAKFYTGSVETIGRFSGKLVCLRCELKPGPESMRLCAREGHRYALSMDEDAMLHPLLAGTGEVLQTLNSAELYRKNVTVDGKYYPATGAILVSQITAKED